MKYSHNAANSDPQKALKNQGELPNRRARRRTRQGKRTITMTDRDRLDFWLKQMAI